MKIRPLIKEEITAERKKKREKKTTRRKDGQSDPTADLETVPGGTVKVVSKLPVAISISKSPPSLAKRQKIPSPPVRTANKQKQLVFSLQHSSFPQTNKDLALQACESLLTRHYQRNRLRLAR